jgi:tungstate transport system permease protein
LVEDFVGDVLNALRLILQGDPTVLSTTARSLGVSGLATLLAAPWAVPVAWVIALGNFRGKKIVKAFFNTLLGIPTVVLGLILYLLFSKSGPLGLLQLLYTPLGMAIGQSILIAPIMISFGTSSIEATSSEVRDLAKTLGASDLQVSLVVAREAIGGIILSIVAAFNRAFSELGIAMMIGGNIANVTRVLTTTIALETAKGDVALSIALGIVLLTIVFCLNLVVNLLRRT